MDRLGGYEDTKFTPEEIEDFKSCLDCENDDLSGELTIRNLIELVHYKNTGLSPEEIEDFKVWLNEDREDLNDITIFNDLSELMKYRKTGIAPNKILNSNKNLKT